MTRILVVRLDSAGDVVVSGPAVRAIASAPGAEVWLLCSPQGAPAARLLPWVHRVLVWAAPWIVDPAPPVTEQHVDALRRMLAEARPDEAVILTSFHQSPLPLALLLRLAGVTRITGVSTDYAGSLLDVRLRPGDDLVEDQPEAMRGLAIAAAAGYAPAADDDGRMHVVPADVPVAVVETLAACGVPGQGSRPLVVVHPGAAVPARAWPPERNREAVGRLAAGGWTVAVTGSPAEAELTRYVAGDRGVDLAGTLDLGQLAGLLALAEVVVVGNTGPAHLAAAVGTPVVSLFAPVVPAVKWAPFGVETVVLGDQEAACRGSRARVCPVPGHPCLASVGADDVVAAVERLATRRPAPLDRAVMPS